MKFSQKEIEVLKGVLKKIEEVKSPIRRRGVREFPVFRLGEKSEKEIKKERRVMLERVK